MEMIEPQRHRDTEKTERLVLGLEPTKKKREIGKAGNRKAFLCVSVSLW
jgi:hypothetical protein